MVRDSWKKGVIGAMAVCALLGVAAGLGGCVQKGASERSAVTPEDRIPLRAHLLDVSTSNLDASDEFTENTDETDLTDRAKAILEELFAGVHNEPRPGDAQVVIAVSIDTLREGTSATAVATLTAYRVASNDVIDVLTEKGLSGKGDLDRDAVIRNSAAMTALENVCWALRGNEKLREHARSLGAFEPAP